MAGIFTPTQASSSWTIALGTKLEKIDESRKNFVVKMEDSIAKHDRMISEILNKTPFAVFHSSSPSLAIESPKNTTRHDYLRTNSSSASVQNKVAIITDNNPWRDYICQKREEYYQLRANLQSDLNKFRKPIKSNHQVREMIQNAFKINEYDAKVLTNFNEMSRAVSRYLEQEKVTSLPMIAGVQTTSQSNGASQSKTQSNGASQSKTVNPSPKKQVVQKSLDEYYRHFDKLEV